AGKGTLTNIVKQQMGDIPFGAVWDAAGEGDAKENAWILQACQARGIKTVFGFAANDPTKTYEAVLSRGANAGRIVDVATVANSYVEGTKNMAAFLSSKEFQEAQKAGTAAAVGVYTGRFDPASAKDPKIPVYPDMHVLGKDGMITSADLPAVPDKSTIIEASV